jgi:methylmalonyl-CoA mutase cobalamin-binding subunit
MELRSGRFQQSISEVASLRQKAFNTRKDVVVGSNQYAPVQDKRHNTHLLPTSQVPDPEVETGIEALPPLRPAMALESLRENSLWSQQQLTLLCYGDAYRPRAEFIEGVFACVGLSAEHSPSFDTPEALITYVEQRIEASSTPESETTEETTTPHTGAQHLMVFCASDSTYPTLLPKVLPRLREAYPQLRFILAGRPGEQRAAYEKLGLRTAFYSGCNILSTLESVLVPLPDTNTH